MTSRNDWQEKPVDWQDKPFESTEPPYKPKEEHREESTTDIERRTSALDGELRASNEPNGNLKIHGYAFRHNVYSRPIPTRDGTGSFREIYKKGAADSFLAAKPDVLCLWAHDPSLVLGRTLAGTLKLFTDSRGLGFSCLLAPSEANRAYHASIKRGDVTGASFSFKLKPGDDSWSHRTFSDDDLVALDSDQLLDDAQEDEDEYEDELDAGRGKRGQRTAIRTIKNFSRIMDVSPVSMPAGRGTSANARSITNILALPVIGAAQDSRLQRIVAASASVIADLEKDRHQADLLARRRRIINQLMGS